MRERQSRRTFLGVSLGCTAPLLLTSPAIEATSRLVAKSGQAAGVGDPVLAHLRQQAIRHYWQVRGAASEAGRIPGEPLRAVAANIGLFQARLAAKGDEGRIDESLRRRLLEDGREVTAAALADNCAAARQAVETRDGIVLPPAPDFGRVITALDALEANGARRALGLVRRWTEWQALQADRLDGRSMRRPVAAGPQKPGDDFGGYPDPNFTGVSCTQMTVMIDQMWLMVAILAWLALPSAEVLAIIVASLQLMRDIYCAGA